MSRHQITRVRHELKRRTLTVARIEDVTPRMRRVHFTCPDLADFPSVGFDDHVKMFMPGSGGDAGMGGGAFGGPGGRGGPGGPGGPGGRGGPGGPGGGRPEMRDFTPRSFDTAAGTMAIDYAIHDNGPAIAWAKTAKVGDTLQVGGPRGSSVVPDDFDWYWLIGDETALPAIGRRLEELRPGVPVASFVIVDGPGEAQEIETRADWSPHWVIRSGVDDGATLIAALDKAPLPPGEGFVWIAAEASAARAVRAAVEARGHPREWLKASGYWQRGDQGVHVHLD